MEVIQAIRSRRAIRGFKPDPIPRKILEELLETCRWAPSTANTQPWELDILGGNVIEEFKNRLVEKSKTHWDNSLHIYRKINLDIPYPRYPEPYLHRQMDLVARIDRHQFPSGTEGLDEKRSAYLLYGSRLYGAPNAIIVYVERAICPKALLDLGIMVQTICLAALEYGLATCIMAIPVFWPEILRELLGIPESKVIELTIAIGYPDPEAPVNSFERPREPLDTFAHWHGI